MMSALIVLVKRLTRGQVSYKVHLLYIPDHAIHAPYIITLLEHVGRFYPNMITYVPPVK